MDRKIYTARDYTVGWLCALPTSEEVAAICMLDHQHEPLRLRGNDRNIYTYGDINHHNVVITCLPPGQSGPVSAQKLVQPLQESFPNMRIHLFVGIGGGVPRNPQPEDPDEDIHLGDVVVGVANNTGAPGVVHWDRRRMTGQNDLPFLSIMDKPARQLTNAVGAMERERIFKRNPFHEQLAKLKDLKVFEYPGREKDRLYQADDSEELVIRTLRAEQHPVFHKGTILSGSSTMENAKERDYYSKKIHNAMRFETEAAGVDEKHCLVIRGISDYADGHKEYYWHFYAAGAAAAFARQLLHTITAPEVESMPVADSQRPMYEGHQTLLMSVFADEGLELTRREIQDWLNAPDPRINQIEAENKCMDDTGLWFVDGQIYEQWRSNHDSFLWLYGFAGCGKTVLCSTIIQRTENLVAQGSSVLAFYYFSFRSNVTTKTDYCIRSIIQQLADRSLDVDALNLLHQKSQGGAPRRKELLDTLRGMLTGFERVFIIIDALDECGDRKELFELLDTLRHWKLDQLRILLTSRDEPDIRKYLNPTSEQQVSLKTSGVDHDIRLFVVKFLEREKNLQQWPDLRGLIGKALVEGAQGMFRWVECQIESLRSCLTRAMVKKALRNLPRSLDETYERILKRVDPAHHNHVIRLLQWLCLADGPIEYESLRHALAVGAEDDAAEEPRYDPEDCFESFEDIISLCPGFLSVCEKKLWRPLSPSRAKRFKVDALQLAHYSVKEFLTSNRFPEAPNPIHQFKINVELANLALVKTCLVYLIHRSRSPYVEALTMRNFFNIEAEGFSNRAAREWVKLCRDAECDSSLTELATSYLTGSNVYFKATNRHLAIVFAISNELYTIAKHLIEDRHIDLNFKIKSSSYFFYESLTPLHVACSVKKPRLDFVRLLLQNNADVNALNEEQETPLLYILWHWSSISLSFTEQDIEIVEILLRHNAEVNTSNIVGMTPLHWAARVPSGGTAVIEVLLQYEADVTARSNFGETPLQAALNGEWYSVYFTDSPGQFLDLLWFEGSLGFKNKKGQNALHLACERITQKSARPQEIVDWLVSKGVDLHAKDEDGLTPILTAAQRMIDTPFQALVPHIKERSAFRGCLAVHLLRTKESPEWLQVHFASTETQRMELVDLIFIHDPDPFGDIKNDVGVLSRFLVEKQGLGLEDNMGIWDTLWGIVVDIDWLDFCPTEFEITKWLAIKLRDESPGLLALELCNAVIRLLQPPSKGGHSDLNENNSQSSQGNDCSESDRQKKDTEVDHKNKKRKRLEEDEDQSSDEEEGKDETGQAEDDNESDRQEENSEADYNDEENPQSGGRSPDQEEDTDSTDDDSELVWDETHSAAYHKSWVSTVDDEAIPLLKELRARLIHQIYG